MKTHRGKFYSFFNLGDRWGWVVNDTSPSLGPRYPLYRRLGGPHGRSGQVRKISPPPGFDSRTVQPESLSMKDQYITVEHESYMHVYRCVYINVCMCVCLCVCVCTCIYIFSVTVSETQRSSIQEIHYDRCCFGLKKEKSWLPKRRALLINWIMEKVPKRILYQTLIRHHQSAVYWN
jgi:hypothetical protein